MIKIRNHEEYEKHKNKIPAILHASVAGEIYIFNTTLDKNYYNGKTIDKYGPMVVVVQSKEFDNISTLIPTIIKQEYEYKEVVGLDRNNYYTKYCYLFNNGELGIILYVENPFYNIERTFNNSVYVTANALGTLGSELLHHLASMVEQARCALNGKLDYLQVFEISTLGDDILRINHRQEVPKYSSYNYIPKMKCDDCKVFWISEKDENGKEYSTIMLAEDY